MDHRATAPPQSRAAQRMAVGGALPLTPARVMRPSC
jgi:hypothetical protein